MPLAFFGIMSVYGLLSCIFAFVEPPRGIAGFFKVPAIFVFLPERYVVPAGRLFMGILCFALVGFFAVKLSGVPTP
jgi:hypothetical protein